MAGGAALAVGSVAVVATTAAVAIGTIAYAGSCFSNSDTKKAKEEEKTESSVANTVIEGASTVLAYGIVAAGAGIPTALAVRECVIQEQANGK